ncbi:alpha/beta hydrolase [Streptomyces hydrogenans]|uniref:alpha/beta hydrolase n=1 Tax=Streptomyces hydrogenans TaxID=1873719 RepID=UPI0033AB1C30
MTSTDRTSHPARSPDPAPDPAPGPRTPAALARRAADRCLAFARRPCWDRPDPAYRVRRWPDLTALCLATVFFWSSLSPSLVPRPWYLQGIVGGITAAIGYALGSTLAWLFRAVVPRHPGERVRVRCWQAYWLLAPLAVLVGVRDIVYDRGIVDVADRIAAATNGGTKAGIERPASRFVSGGPGSLLGWDSLGYEGRNFTGSTPTRAALTAWSGRPSRDPVRVYVPSTPPVAFGDDRPYAAQAALAVRELDRTGAFDRAVLAVAGTTGTGWVDPNVAEALEYMYRGDTAIVAVQYSYLPSWVSFLVDKEKAGQATRALVDAVRARLATLPEDRRPKLVVTGESLGAYAVEASFGSVDALLAGTDGALLMGPPDFSPISRELRRDRDPGSPVWRPEYDGGRHVRFGQFPAADLARPAAAWGHPRVVYLQNASDPVVWWSPGLLLDRPRWLSRPLGPDITPEIRWFPFVTFWQTSVDMAVSYGVDAPHGHRYGAGAVDGWAAVVPPEGWTDADTTRLRAYIGHRRAAY